MKIYNIKENKPTYYFGTMLVSFEDRFIGFCVTNTASIYQDETGKYFVIGITSPIKKWCPYEINHRIKIENVDQLCLD